MSDETDPWRVGHCRACGASHFPARTRCPRCWETELDVRTIDEPGRLETFTTVHRAIGDREVPYTVGWATFAGSRVRVFGVVRSTDGPVRVGEEVRFVRRRRDDPPYVLVSDGGNAPRAAAERAS